MSALAQLQQAASLCPICARPYSETSKVRITRTTPDATIERQPDTLFVSRANPFPQTDPLAPARTACRALVRRYVSETGDTVANILAIACANFVKRNFNAQPLSAGELLASVMLTAGRVNAQMLWKNGASREANDPSVATDKRTRLDTMAFVMLALQAEEVPVENWHLYERGFTRAEVLDLGWEAAQLAECIARVIAEAQA